MRTEALQRASKLLGVAALAAAAGCAALGARPAGERLRAALDGVTIERPLDDVWAAARHLLGERGYALAGKDRVAEGQSEVDTLGYLSRAAETTETAAGGRRLETGWDGRRVRYSLEARPSGGGWRVRYTAVHEHLTDHGHDGWAERDAPLELELLRRLDPERAARIVERPDGPAGGAPAAPAPR